MSWLDRAPRIKLLPDTHKRQPYPLNWDEQKQLFSALPPHLAEMALFAVNTGCRDAEICNLQWDWEVKVPQLETFVFIVPGQFVKNVDDPGHQFGDLASQRLEVAFEHRLRARHGIENFMLGAGALEFREPGRLGLLAPRDVASVTGDCCGRATPYYGLSLTMAIPNQFIEPRMRYQLCV